MKRTVDQMDEKDWIIIRLMSVIGHFVGPIAALSIDDYWRTCQWLDDNLTLMNNPAWGEVDPIKSIHIEQGFTIADWPYATVDDPLPAECQLITPEI